MMDINVQIDGLDRLIDKMDDMIEKMDDMIEKMDDFVEKINDKRSVNVRVLPKEPNRRYG